MPARIFRTAPMVLTLLTILATRAEGQERRRSPDGAGGAPANAPTYARMPFAGAWQGTRRMKDGPGIEDEGWAVVIEADTAARKYAVFVIHPDGVRTPVQQLKEANGVLSWRQPNSGGGAWHYTARLVDREKLEGTLILRDWPQGGGATPSGTFTLLRRPAG